MISRRIFLKSSGLALVSLGLAPRFLAGIAAAERSWKGKILVTIFQRGAAPRAQGSSLSFPSLQTGREELSQIYSNLTTAIRWDSARTLTTNCTNYTKPTSCHSGVSRLRKTTGDLPVY